MRTPAALRRKALAQLAREQRLTKRLQAIDGSVVDLGKPSKMRNRKTMYRGDVYDSLGEAEYAAYLDMLIVAGTVIEYERQVWVTVQDGPKASDRTRMRIDFHVHWPGEWTYEDFKGRVLRDFMLRVKMGWRRNVPHKLYVVTKNDQGGFDRKMVADGVIR